MITGSSKLAGSGKTVLVRGKIGYWRTYDVADGLASGIVLALLQEDDMTCVIIRVE